MADKVPLTTDSAPSAHPDWPTLIDRAVGDVSRIIQSELHTLQASVCDDLEARVGVMMVSLAFEALIVSGAICILCASVLLLHQWIPWWQALGGTGLVTLVAGIVGNVAIRSPSRVKI